MKSNKREKLSRIILYSFILTAILLIFYGGGFLGISEKIPTTVSAQQDPFLSQRLNQIEQKLNSLESRMYRLEQDSRFPTVTPRTNENNDIEVRLLRSQVEILEQRLREIECGVIKLDERTLPPAARQAQKNSVDRSNLCRLKPNEPIQMIVRP